MASWFLNPWKANTKLVAFGDICVKAELNCPRLSNLMSLRMTWKSFTAWWHPEKMAVSWSLRPFLSCGGTLLMGAVMNEVKRLWLNVGGDKELINMGNQHCFLKKHILIDAHAPARVNLRSRVCTRRHSSWLARSALKASRSTICGLTVSTCLKRTWLMMAMMRLLANQSNLYTWENHMKLL